MRTFCLCLLCLYTVLPSIAQLNYSFTHYSSENGLSQNTVMNILEDSKGYMWFATWDGINKFDGYTFKVYKPNDDSSVNFTNNRADHIYEDKGGYIWVLSYDNRAHRLDPKTERFTQVPSMGEESSYYIKSIKVLPNSDVWLITRNDGGIRIPFSEEGIITTEIFSVHTGVLQTKHIADIFPDTSRNEWLLTGNGLYRYNVASGNPVSYFSSQSSGETTGQAFYSFLEDAENLWFGSSEGKVWKYNTREEFFELKEFAVHSDITAMELLQDNELIFATTNDGFFTYDKVNNHTHYYNYGNSTLPGNSILSLYVDKYKEVWMDIAGVTGVSHFNPYTKRIIHEVVYTEKGSAERSDPKFHIHEDVNGFLWVHPYGGGFSRYNREKRRLEPFYNQPGSPDWRFSNKLHCVYSDRAGNLWMCTHSKGLEKVSFFTNTFQLTRAEDLSYESLTNYIRCLYEDHRKRIWSSARDGKIRVHDAAGNYLGYLTREGIISRSGVQADGVAYHIMQDRENTFWISTKGEGLIRMREEGNTFRMEYFKHNPADEYNLSDNNVYWSHATDDGRIWVATFGRELNYTEPTPEGEVQFIRTIFPPIRSKYTPLIKTVELSLPYEK